MLELIVGTSNYYYYKQNSHDGGDNKGGGAGNNGHRQRELATRRRRLDELSYHQCGFNSGEEQWQSNFKPCFNANAAYSLRMWQGNLHQYFLQYRRPLCIFKCNTA